MKRSFIVALLGLTAACQSNPRVSLDLSAMIEHAAQTDAPIDVVTLWVFDADGELLEERDLDPARPDFELRLEPAVDLRFEVEARGDGVPSYWGEAVLSALTAGEDVDLVIPIRPAGGLTGSVIALGGASVPDDLEVIVRSPGQPEDVRTEFSSGRLVQGRFGFTLPVGAWSVGLTSLPGELSILEPLPNVEIVHAQVRSGVDVRVGGPLPECTGVEDFDADGATCDVDCDDTNSALNLRDDDRDQVTSCDGDCNDQAADCVEDCITNSDLDNLIDCLDDDDDDDGVLDEDDEDPKNPLVCSDIDADGCDDCALGGGFDPDNDGVDTDGDGQCELGGEDVDTDGDGVLDAMDTDPTDPRVCADLDGDDCDDCSVDIADTRNDGPDRDGDEICDLGDPDDDNDGVLDAEDPQPQDPTACGDVDGDQCDDCAIGVDGFGPEMDQDPNNDGPDLDGDGLCDAGDPDDDNDGVDDGIDIEASDPSRCEDIDSDGCDDCAIGNDQFGPANDANAAFDGPDLDQDGLCDFGDLDRDGDTLAPGPDVNDSDPYRCTDSDGDFCDDCSVAGRAQPANDGPDLDGDGLCDAGDGDIDGDGILNEVDLCPLTVGDGADLDGDGFGDVCDCDDAASSCTTDCNTDLDSDGIPDCRDQCIDDDGDDLGVDASQIYVGHSPDPVGGCFDGTGPCSPPGPTCNGPSPVQDIDGDGILDEFDFCLDADADGAGAGATAFGPPTRVDLGTDAFRGHPTILPAGVTTVVAWQDDRTGNGDIYAAVSSDGGASFGPEIVVDGGGGFQSRPAGASDGTVMMLVYEDDPGTNRELVSRVSTNQGGSWDPAQSITGGVTGSQEDPTVAVNGGIFVAAWTDFRDGDADIYFARSIGGAAWSAPIRVDDATPGEPSLQPSLVYGPGGILYLAWTEDRGGAGDRIRFSRSTDGGTSWSPSREVALGPGFAQRSPHLTVGFDGEVWLAWEDFDGGPEQIFLSRSDNGGHLFEPGVHLAPGPQPQHAPQVRFVDDILFAAWSEGPQADEDILVIRSPDGKSFEPPRKLPVDPTGDESQPALMVDSGQVSVAWHDFATLDAIQFASAGVGCRGGWDCDDSNAFCAADCGPTGDADGDGACRDFDCNDGDPDVGPLAPEMCDYRDNNCDQRVDEGVGTELFADAFDPIAASGWATGVVSGTANDWSIRTTSLTGASGPVSFPSNVYGTDGNGAASGQQEHSFLASPSFDASGVRSLGFSFIAYSYNESGCAGAPDEEILEVDYGAGWSVVGPCPLPRLHDPYVGGPVHVFNMLDGATFPTVQVRFRFDTGPVSGGLEDDGWYVDDVRIHSCD